MTKQELASLLNGRKYMHEITKEEADAAKAAGLVVIFGYSYDNVELRGAIHDEIGAYDGTTLYLHQGGVLESPESVDCDRCESRLKEDRKRCLPIAVCWIDGGDEPYCWFIKPDTDGSIDFASFDIVDDSPDDGKFCRGIVIDIKDLPKLN